MWPCKNSRMRQDGSLMLLKFSLLFIALIPSLGWTAGEITIPEGARITLQLNDPLSTKRNNEGDAFKAIVVTPVSIGDRIAIPKGSVVAGSISRIKRPGVIKGKPLMNLLFQSVNIPGHGDHAIVAKLEEVNDEKNSGVYPEGTIKGEDSNSRDVGRIIAPGILGAGIGGLANGGKGAAIGSGIGAAVGIATVFSTRGKDLELSRGATLIISLERPLLIPADNDSETAKNR
jgi:hypothetical protein